MKEKLVSEATSPLVFPDKTVSTTLSTYKVAASNDRNSMVVNTSPAAPKVDSGAPTAPNEDLAKEEDTISTSLFDLNDDDLAKLYAMEEEITKAAESRREASPNGSQISASMNEIAAIEQAEKSLTALESGSVLHAEIASWEEEMAAIEAALMAHMPSHFASLEEFMAEEIADGQKDMLCKDTADVYVEMIN